MRTLFKKAFISEILTTGIQYYFTQLQKLTATTDCFTIKQTRYEHASTEVKKACCPHSNLNIKFVPFFTLVFQGQRHVYSIKFP